MRNTSCIKCGAKRQAGDLECPQCGVIYARAEKAAAAERQRKMDEARAKADAIVKKLQDNESVGYGQTAKAEAINDSDLREQASKQDDERQPEPAAQKTNAGMSGCAIVAIIFTALLAIGFFSGNDDKGGKETIVSKAVAPTPAANYAKAFVAATNSTVGHLCHAEIKGFFGNTLRLSWTSQTNKLHAIQILAQVGEHKKDLYESGIRYFQIPNDAGMYNQFDWETGEKKSIADSAGYYFRD